MIDFIPLQSYAQEFSPASGTRLLKGVCDAA